MTRLKTVCIQARDLERSRKFWVDLVGWSVLEAYDDQLVVGGPDTEILLDGTEDAQLGMVELILGCDPAEFDRICAAIEQGGAEVVRPAKDWGGPLGMELTVADPSGHRICFFREA